MLARGAFASVTRGIAPAPMRRGIASFSPNSVNQSFLAMQARRISTSPRLWQERSSAETTSEDAQKAASGERPMEQTEAARAALWNQMLNAIIVDPSDSSVGAPSSHRRPATSASTSLDGTGISGLNPSSENDRVSLIEQLDAEFRDRPTFGMASPGTPTTGRSVSVNSAFNGTSAYLYRQLSQILSRNNVRRELRLVERYEKPNQKRRRKRSERHRRRFADMVRKKIQLVSPAGSPTY